jgi:hypothetical protein
MEILIHKIKDYYINYFINRQLIKIKQLIIIKEQLFLKE